MSTLVDYRGLQVVSPDPTGEGGLAIQNDLKDLVDWHPKSVWAQTADPTASDDESADFFPGSLWLRTDVTPPKLFVCRSNSPGAAVWTPILLQVQQDTAPKLGGNLDVNGKLIVSSSHSNIVINPHGTGNTVISNGRLNIGVASTARGVLEVDKNSGSTFSAHFRNLNTLCYGVWIEEPAGATSGSPLFYISSDSGGETHFRVNAVTGNIGIGTQPFSNGGGTKCIMHKNGSPPTSGPADMFQMYSADIAPGNAAPHFRTEAGAVIKLYQQAHIADPSGGSTQDTEARTAINAILAALENAGLLATS